MPGEIEARTKQQRLAEGIELDDITWKSLCDTAQAFGVAVSI
jgi:LDH2 family malate/lactate/ureidoglycolate dehydrogenase